MALTYRAELNYSFTNSSKQKKELTVPISLFAVEGGPKRVIELRNRDDVSIISELEQARARENICVAMPPMQGPADMQATLDLTNAFASKSDILLRFSVYKFQNGKCIEGFRLYSLSTFKEPPQMVMGLLRLFFTVNSASELTRTMYNPGKNPKSFQM